MPSTPTSTLISLPVIAAPVTSNGPMSQQIERAALAKHAVEDRAAGLQETQRLAVPVDHIDAAGGNRGDPEVAFGVDFQAIGNVALGHRMDDLFARRQACAARPSRCRISTQTTEPVRFNDDAVWIDMVKLLEHARLAVCLDDNDAPRMRLRVQAPNRPNGEISRPSGPKARSLGPSNFDAVSLGDEDLDFSGRAGLLDGRRTVDRSDQAPTLGVWVE